jgi:hypothetical protein
VALAVALEIGVGDGDRQAAAAGHVGGAGNGGSEYWPNFQFLVANMVAYSSAIDGPFFESDRWAKRREP